jgi:hypothetical protein
VSIDTPPLPALLIASARARTAAVRLLACLYQGLLDRCPLVVSVAAEPPFPDDDFRALLDLVQAALPSRLSRQCRNQWFPEDVDQVLGANLADLVVLDQDHAALTGLADPPFEVDQDGEPLSGDEPDARLLDYAKLVIAAVLERPQWLPNFAQRFDTLLGDQVSVAPSANQVMLIPVVYDLAECFACGSVGASGIIRRYLLGPARRGTLPWSELVSAAEWSALDRTDLTALIQTPAKRLDPGERSLQTAAVESLAAAGWQLADAAVPWRRSDDPAWWERLMELVRCAPSLIPQSLLADLGRGQSLAGLPESVLTLLLDAELRQGTLWRRRFQRDALVGVAAVPGVFAILAEGVKQGELDDEWCVRLLAGSGGHHLAHTGIEILSHLPRMMTADLAAVLLADTTALPHLDPAALLRLVGLCAAEAGVCERAYRALDDWMKRDPGRTVGALIAADAWRPWRLGAQPLQEVRQPLALLWLTHPAHASARAPLGLHLPECQAPLANWPETGASGVVSPAAMPVVTMATWRIVMEDLVAGLSADDVRRLAAPHAHWPWICPCERHQIADLASRCRDLGALAELAAILHAEEWPLDQDLARHLIGASRFAAQVSADAFAWICAEDGADHSHLSAPTLAESDILCAGSGERMALAVQARVAAVTATLAIDPRAALAAANNPPLWNRADFQAALGRLLDRASAPPEWFGELQRRLNDAGIAIDDLRQAPPPGAGGGGEADLVAETPAGATHMSEETAHEDRLWATVLDRDGAGPRQVAIPHNPHNGAYRYTLRCTPGADAVHIPISDAQGVRFRCEIPAGPGGLVDLMLTPDEDNGWILASSPPHLRVLPAKAAEPLPVIPNAAVPVRSSHLPGPMPRGNEAVRWEVVLVIDRTARWFQPKATDTLERSGLLLAHPQLWGDVCAKLIALLQGLAQGSGNADIQFSVLAFGDFSIAGVDARQLIPTYPVFVPEQLRMSPFEPAVATDRLRGLEATATPGGDFVDALAEALARCKDVWTSDTGIRRLLVVFGDSPGHSIAHPVRGGDAQVRLADVDREAEALHAKGVEILTLYHRPPAELELPATGKARALLHAAAEQYRRLASVPGYALDFADFEPAVVARELRARAFPIGRGASYGLTL